jgi:hypothetical protein
MQELIYGDSLSRRFRARKKKHLVEISFVSGAFVMSDSLSAELMGPSVEQCREKREKVENDAEFFWLINLWCEFSNI